MLVLKTRYGKQVLIEVDAGTPSASVMYYSDSSGTWHIWHLCVFIDTLDIELP